MLGNYKDLVVKSYQEKLASRDLSNNLSDPTPAKLRDECLSVYTSRYNKETDYKILEAFFGKPDEHGNYYWIIYNVNVPLFRPLAQFLRDMSRKPNTRNIELLAWLIDYQPDDDEEAPSTRTWKDRVKKYWKEAALVPVLSGLILFLIIKLPQQEQCMYWSRDRYETVDCNKKIFGRQIIALDTFKLHHFRKITRPDTMTAYSVGRVWYVHIEAKPDCFTSDGVHPLHPERELKRLTLPIIRRYFGTEPTDSINEKQ